MIAQTKVNYSTLHFDKISHKFIKYIKNADMQNAVLISYQTLFDNSIIMPFGALDEFFDLATRLSESNSDDQKLICKEMVW